MAERKRSRRRTLRLVVILVIVAAGGYLIWWATHRPEGYTGGDIVTTGTIEATSVALSFQVSGRIAAVPVIEGDHVRTGEIVASLDTADLDAAVRSARASLQTARADSVQAEANLDLAGRNLARMRELMSSDATTPQQLDDAVNAERVARARLASVRSQIHEAEVRISQADLSLSYAVLRCPRDGQVTEKIHRTGEVVAAGLPVLTVTELDTVKAVAPVYETRVGAVRPGDQVLVRSYTFDNKTFPGFVADISAAGDFATQKDWGAERRDIRTFLVRAYIPNPEGLLKDGMTAEVTIVPGSAARAAARARP